MSKEVITLSQQDDFDNNNKHLQDLKDEKEEKKQQRLKEEQLKKNKKRKQRQSKKKALAKAEKKQLNEDINSAKNELLRQKRKKAKTDLAYGKNKLKNSTSKIYDAVLGGYCKVQNAAARIAKTVFTLPVIIIPLFFCFVWFCNLGGYDILSMLTPAHKMVYQFYVSDYSVGFCSRLLVGAVTGLFADKISIADINLIANISIIVLFALEAVLAGAVLRKSLIQKQPLLTILVLLFCLNPLTSQQNMPIHGSLDVFIIIVFVVELFIIDKKYLSLITAALCLVCMTIHYHFLFSFLPPILALLFYKAFFAEDKKTRRLYAANFGISSIFSGSIFLYFVFFAKNHLKTTADEFYSHMVSRFDITQSEASRLSSLMNGNVLYRDYYDYYIFGQYKGGSYYDTPNSFLEFLKNYAANHTSSSITPKYLMFIAPIMLAFFVLWLICFIKEKGAKRLPYAVFMLMPLVLLPELIISTDVWRWAASTLISQFAVIFVLAFDKQAKINTVLKNRFFNNPVTIAVVLAAAVFYVKYAVTFGQNMPVF